MERGSKVEEIKRRFEDLNCRLNDQHKTSPNYHFELNNLKKLSPVSCCGGVSTNDLKINGEAQKIKRTPAFRSSAKHCSSSSRPKPIREEPDHPELSVSVKERLQSPLPSGPAPRKPPRTFAHSNKMNGSPSTSPPDPSSLRQFHRSKTEPLIKLNKIENALKRHQAASRNIYDTVADDTHISNGKPIEPVYSEPICYKQVTRECNGNFRQNSSLYYMSTPVVGKLYESSKSAVSRKSSYEEAVQKIQMLMTEQQLNKADADSDAESAKEVKAEVVEERKIYAKRVSSMRQPPPNRPHTSSERLMDALLLVGIDSDMSNEKTAFIKTKYPANAKVADNLACLIFPDATDWPPLCTEPIGRLPLSAVHNNYTVVLTDAEGVRSYAYCRRLQPEGSSFCLPLAYAIITHHKATYFYYKVLEEIENNHGLPEAKYNEFVRSLYRTTFPKEAQAVKIGELVIHRSRAHSYHEENDISKLLQALRVPNFLQLISSILLEKKIILVSSYISMIADAIEAISKSLYPFEWQHTLITVLPPSMFEILQSPSPYLLGLLKTRSQTFNAAFFQNIDYVFVVDLDRGSIICHTDNQGSVLPERVAKTLNVALYLTPVHTSDVAPSEALLRMFVELLGHYNRFLISSHPQASRIFQRESFIKASPSRSIRSFLEWFTETSMFQVFITQKMSRQFPHGGVFDRRCAEYAEEHMKKGKSINKAFVFW